MKQPTLAGLSAIVVVPFIFVAAFGQDPASESDQDLPQNVVVRQADLPATIDDARARAELLHETLHGVLQVMHRDFFDEEDGRRIPSASLEDVFKELHRSKGVEFRWLGVNAKTMDIDHEPRDEFEKSAVKALSAGKKSFEAVEDGRYRRVGVIDLHNTCLKCHVPNRTSLEDRAAGLVINMPLGKIENAPDKAKQENQ